MKCMYCSRELSAAESHAHSVAAADDPYCGPEICFQCEAREKERYAVDPPNPFIHWLYDHSSQRSGSEGPRHDPYGYIEYTFSLFGLAITLHAGLGDYVIVESDHRRTAPCNWWRRTFHIQDRWQRGPVDSHENRRHWRSGFSMLASMAFGWLFTELEGADAHWQTNNPDPYDIPLSYYE